MVAVNLKVLEHRRQLPYEELLLEGVMVGVGVVLLSPPPWLAPQKHGIITTATISAEDGHAHLGGKYIFFSKQAQHDYFL